MLKRFSCALFLFLLCAIPALAQSKSKTKKQSQQESAYFIGNSYTFCNDLPRLLEEMSSIQTASRSAAAAQLRQFTVDQTPELIRKGKYNWVILQDQSQTPAMAPDITLKAAKELSAIIKETGAKPVLFLTWAHLADGQFDTFMQDALSRTYCRAAIENEAIVAPVGEAWRKWYAQYPNKRLHVQDGSHPNLTGSYLAACVIYASLTGKRPLGLPAPKGINAKTVKECQRIAAETMREFCPEKFLEQLKNKRNALPSPQDIRPMLTRELTRKQLQAKLGKAIYIEEQNGVYQYPIQGGNLLVTNFSKQGKLVGAAFIINDKPEIITLD